MEKNETDKWVVDGERIDDAICDKIMQSRSRYDGVHYDTAEDALEALLEDLRDGRYNV